LDSVGEIVYPRHIMKDPIKQYWNTRIKKCQKALAANNFEVFVVPSAARARDVALKKIIPATGAGSVSWGGSQTFKDSGLYDALKDSPSLKALDTYDKTISRDEVLERRRQALLVDLFISGTNAVTETGILVNLDMIGNRAGAITFGPKHVLILAGRNKIVPDVGSAMERIKDYAAPVNARRLAKKTPCARTSLCRDCDVPDRICNTWVITEKSFPKDRIKVVLINEDMGF